MRKYPALNPLSPPKGSSTKKKSQPTQQNSSLVSTLQSKILQFRTTHLLVSRLKSPTKDHLIADLDILTSTLRVKYLNEDLCASIDENAFEFFTHNDPIRYHCLLILATPVNVSSAPDGSKPFQYFPSPIKLIHLIT